MSQTPGPLSAGEGDLEPVPTAAVVTLPPAPLDEPADVGDDLEVSLEGLRPVQVTGRGPGQVSGPGGRGHGQRGEHRHRDALEVDGLAVSLAYAGTEAGPVDAGPPSPSPDRCPPGGR